MLSLVEVQGENSDRRWGHQSQRTPNRRGTLPELSILEARSRLLVKGKNISPLLVTVDRSHESKAVNLNH